MEFDGNGVKSHGIKFLPQSFHVSILSKDKTLVNYSTDLYLWRLLKTRFQQFLFLQFVQAAWCFACLSPATLRFAIGFLPYLCLHIFLPNKFLRPQLF